MFKSKWVRIPVKIILIGLVITLYFYFQHPMVYRCLDFGANIPIGDGQLLIHEIRVSNLDDQRYTWMDNEEMPWRVKVMQRMYELGLSLNWQNPVYKALVFYSWPPLADDFWTYKIYGTYIRNITLVDLYWIVFLTLPGRKRHAVSGRTSAWPVMVLLMVNKSPKRHH